MHFEYTNPVMTLLRGQQVLLAVGKLIIMTEMRLFVQISEIIVLITFLD